GGVGAQGPARPRRRRMTADTVLRDMPGLPFEDPIEGQERGRVRRQIDAALRAALAQLTEDDRRLIAARYQHQAKISAVAARMGGDAKVLHPRRERALRTLARAPRA